MKCARPFVASFLFVAVFIESFREARRLVIGAESPRRQPASLSSPFGRTPIYPGAIRESRKRKAGVEPDEQGGERAKRQTVVERSRTRRRNIAERIVSSRERSSAAIHISSREGKTRESTAGAASRARRGVRACHRR